MRHAFVLGVVQQCYQNRFSCAVQFLKCVLTGNSDRHRDSAAVYIGGLVLYAFLVLHTVFGFSHLSELYTPFGV